MEVDDEEEARPIRFFDDPNEPMRLEDLPADPEEVKFLEELFGAKLVENVSEILQELAALAGQIAFEGAADVQSC